METVIRAVFIIIRYVKKIRKINESETIIKEIKEGKRKGYKNIKSLFEALNK